ncbi:uncharacterized protein LOC130636526 [Hydractinia symbiolongicarpus]|uniref:uncharacterized protein LOC130636526 n=1 Tax=Hydractinia symbiolongicarpus TaxID=13093 RepID=UPI0025510583|nr:uncharacterized protein LOC130636526 [Hydractinia symbiolongicarpus]
MGDFAKYNKVRKSVVRTANKLITRGETIISSYTDNVADVRQIESIRDTLMEKIAKVAELNESIMDCLTEQDDIDKEEDSSTEEMMMLKDKLRLFESFLEKRSAKKDFSEAGSTFSHSKLIKLPRLHLQPFDGHPENWSTFWDSFECAVHTNDDISDVQKMTYLKNLVEGPAASCIAGFRLSNENYKTVVDLLKERYNNKQLLISAHMKKLLKLEQANNLTNIETLRNVFDNVETQVRSLENLDVTSENYGPLLIPVLMSKLPEELNLIISRQFNDKDCWDMKLVLRALKSEIEVREKSAYSLQQPHDNNPFSSSALPVHYSHQSNRDLPHNQYQNNQHNYRNHQNNQNNYRCIFCDKSHKSQQCRIITNFDARKNVLRDKKRCFVCLKGGHLAKSCYSKISCLKCSGRHHVAICDKKRDVDQGRRDKDGTEQEKPENVAGATSLVTSSNSLDIPSSVMLQTAKVKVVNTTDPSKIENTRILFDNCSQLSYISPELCEKLQLKVVGKREICIRIFGKHSFKETLDRVQFSVIGLDGDKINVDCYVKNICHPLTGQNFNDCLKYKHLKDLRLADSNCNNRDLKVDVLLGADNYWKFFDGGIVRGEDGPVALNSKVGYIVSGRIGSSEGSRSAVLVANVLKIGAEFVEDKLDNQLEKFWSFENAGIEEQPAVENFCENVKFSAQTKRYEVRLPFKDDHDVLPDNYCVSSKRLESLRHKLKNNPELLRNYNSILKEQLEQGIIERVTNDDCTKRQVHYLPHRPVIRDDKPSTKVRMVFDASSKSVGLSSLNDCLYAGPSLTEPLYNVLLRFRSHKVAFIADIEKAFLQISLHPTDRDFVRFIWFKDLHNLSEQNIETAEIGIYRLSRVLFGVSSSPFLLSATLIKHAESFNHVDPLFVQKLLSSLHVDDLTSGGATVNAAHDFYQKCKQRLAEANFNLHKFHSNSEELEQLVTKPHVAHTGHVTKVLGVLWDKKKDSLLFTFDDILSLAKDIPTKRQLIKFTASIYDPLGLINPIVMRLKTLFQKTCVGKIGWDIELSGQVLDEWRVTYNDFKSFSHLNVPRCYDGGNIVDVQLHGFSDASLKGYGACVYLRFEHADGSFFTKLVTSKSRIAPIKPVTIPRLELYGAVMLAKLVKYVRDELSLVYDISVTRCWIDSSIVLYWIKNVNKKYEVVVERRVGIIRDLVSPDSWFHVESKANPADILSRGCLVSELVNNNLWFSGPDFLRDTNISASSFNFSNFKVDDSTCLIVGNDESEESTEEEIDLNFMNIARYSNYTRLLRITALVLRFVGNLRKKRRKEELVLHTFVTKDEQLHAKKLWIKYAQKDIIQLPSYKQLQKDLRFQNIDGIIRCKGRLENAPLDFDTKFPIFLPKKNPLTRLVILHYHVQVLHNGLKETLNAIRSKFWIPKARNYIKQLIRQCYLCRYYEGKSYAYPVSPALPKSRLSNHHPFKHTGLDYAGPLYVRNVYHGGSMYKAWVFLFTCTSTRALHLDLVPDASSSGCIRSLRRFFSEREAAPWWGGMFERLVRSVKRCLKKTLHNTRLSYEELLTVLAEIQAVINNRPLTFLYENIGEQPLTPNHLLFGRKINLEASHIDSDENEKDLCQRYDHLQRIINHYWNRWKCEYLTELREYHRVGKSRGETSIRINDVVLIEEAKQPRQNWKMGVVEEFVPSRDGKKRGAVVRYVLNGNTHTIRRPINKLYPVELAKDEAEKKEKVNITFIDENDIITNI